MQRSGFFNSNNGDRVYDATDFAAYFGRFVSNGIFYQAPDNLKVMAAAGMNIAVLPGAAYINGYNYENTSPLNLLIAMPNGIDPRIDRIVIRWDSAGRNIYLDIKSGVPAPVPTAPELTRNSDIYELGIADIFVARAVTEIKNDAISDTRLDTFLCGIVNSLVDTVIRQHIEETILSERGVHGIRFFHEQLQIWNGLDWETINASPPAPGLPPGDVTNLTAVAGNGEITISWNDPEDIPNGVWQRTRVCIKAGSYPANENDGFFVQSTVRDEFADTGYTATGLTNGTTYYIHAFPVSNQDIVNFNNANRATGTPQLPTPPAASVYETAYVGNVPSMFTATASGWYKFLVWGASSKGVDGQDYGYNLGGTYIGGHGGKGGSTGGGSAHYEWLNAGGRVMININASKSVVTGDNFEITATAASTGTGAGSSITSTPGTAAGGNITNLSGAAGGAGGAGGSSTSGTVAQTGTQGGNSGAPGGSGGAASGTARGGGGGGGGARAVGSGFCKYVVPNMNAYRGGNGNGGAGSSMPAIIPGPEMVITGAGCGSAGRRSDQGSSGHVPGGTGQPGVVIVERGVDL